MTITALAGRFPSIAVGLAAAAIHAAFWLALPEPMQRNQSTDYFEVNEPVARRIAAGLGVTTPTGAPAVAKPPGQSLLLAGCFWFSNVTGLSESFVLRTYVVLTMGLSGALLYRLFSVLLFAGTGALWAVAIWTLHPMTLWIAKQPNTEVPFFALFFGALLAASYRSVAAGLLTGVLVAAAMLVRPIAILIPAVLLAWLWLGARLPLGRVAAFGLALAAGLGLVLAPWEIWVWQKLGRWVLLGEHGTSSLMDGLTFGVKGGDMGATLVRVELLPLMQELFDEQIAGHMETTGQVFRYLAKRFTEEPLLIIELFAVKTARSWFGTNGKWMELAIAGVQLPFLLFAIRGLRRLWRAGGAFRSYALLALLLTAYFWAMTVSVLSIVRYLLPPMALLCAAVAAGLGLAGPGKEPAISGPPSSDTAPAP